MLIFLINTIILGLALSVDSFSIAIAVGSYFPSVILKQKLKLIVTFMVCHFGMLLIGWLFGDYLIQYISQFDHWIVFAVLALLGGKMIYESIKGEEKEDIEDGFFGLRNLLFLALATSLDALAIGFSFALKQHDIWLPNVIISIIVGLITFIGLSAGKKLGEKFPEVMEIIAGIVLILIGVLSVLEHYDVIVIL